MMFTRSYARIIFLLVLSLIVLILPNLLRNYDTYIGEDPYFYSRISDLIDKGAAYDELSYSGRELSYSIGQTLAFSLTKNIMTEKYSIIIIPIILGLLSLLLFYLILKEFYVEPNVSYFSLVFLSLSPPFIYIFGSYTQFTIVTFILFLNSYFFIRENKSFNFISYLLFFVIPFFGYQYSIFILSLTLLYSLKKKEMNRFYSSLIISLISLALIYYPYLFKYGFSERINFDNKSEYQLLFSDLGSQFGISIFVIFLSAFGLNYLWKSKYKYLRVYLMLILFIIFTLYIPSLIIYFNILLSLFSSLGLVYLLRSRWESEKIRKLTMWLLIAGLIFSTITFVNQLTLQQPNQNLYNSLIFLKGYNSQKEVVFSHYSYGVLINSISDKKNVLDSKFLYAPKLKERYKDYETLLYTRNANIAHDIIKKYKIKYIVVTKEMKEGLVWNQKEEGLLFLLNSVNIYKRIYYNDEVEVWRIKE